MKEIIRRMKNKLSDARTLGNIRGFPIMEYFRVKQWNQRNLAILKVVNGSSSNLKPTNLESFYRRNLRSKLQKMPSGRNKSLEGGGSGVLGAYRFGY